MKTGVSEMACGGCGNGLFRMFKGNDGTYIAECCACESSTIITVTAKVELKWGESKVDIGILATMKPERFEHHD